MKLRSPVKIAASCFVGAMFYLATLSSLTAAEAVKLIDLTDDKILVENLYEKPERLIPFNQIDESGRIKKNDGSKLYIDAQKIGGDFVQAGVEIGDDELIRKGLKILDWGFHQQLQNGGFETELGIHGTTLFTESAGRAILLLQQSGNTQFADEIAAMTPKVTKAALWIKNQNGGVGNGDIYNYNHHAYQRAAALKIAATIDPGNPAMTDLRDAAGALAETAINQQFSDGTNPELGENAEGVKDQNLGFDVSYQMLGLTYASRYYSVCDSVGLRDRLIGMMLRAASQVAEKINSEGAVSTDGSVRTGRELNDNGNAKPVDFKNFVQGLVYVGEITGDSKYRELAENVAEKKW